MMLELFCLLQHQGEVYSILYFILGFMFFKKYPITCQEESRKNDNRLRKCDQWKEV